MGEAKGDGGSRPAFRFEGWGIIKREYVVAGRRDVPSEYLSTGTPLKPLDLQAISSLCVKKRPQLNEKAVVNSVKTQLMNIFKQRVQGGLFSKPRARPSAPAAKIRGHSAEQNGGPGRENPGFPWALAFKLRPTGPGNGPCLSGIASCQAQPWRRLMAKPDRGTVPE